MVDKQKIVFIVRVADVEALLGRKITQGEFTSLRKSMEGLNEEAMDVVSEHFYMEDIEGG